MDAGRQRLRRGSDFFDHMLNLVARHGAFDLTIEAKGDLNVDQHHTVEDVGIALGEAVAQAIGNKKGILRAGYFLMPMDETLAAAAVDLSGRPYCVVNAKIKAERVGEFQVELLEDFLGDLRQRRARMCICGVCTAGRRITKWKRCSRLSRGPCDLQWRVTSD